MGDAGSHKSDTSDKSEGTGRGRPCASALGDGRRTVIISSRLPVKAELVDGKPVVRRSSGGLVSGLKPVHEEGRSLWVGCLGLESTGLEGPQPGVGATELAKLRGDGLHPVEVPPSLYRGYYDGFSNGAVWPLFHYMTERAHFEESQWEDYKAVNKLFAEAVLEVVEEGDRLWVHDYQLMLLPAMLRRMCGELSIGFFLHIPFPAADVFRVLPWRAELLRGMLGADLIGFHTLEYMRHFSNSTARVLGLEPHLDTLAYGRRAVRLGAFPLGIDARAMNEQAHDEATERALKAFTQSYKGRKVVLGVDRLDYTKGIPDRLRAFAGFLERYPDWIGRVSMVQLSVPSRVQVEEYQELKAEVDGLVGMINGRFGAPGYVPIHYMFRNLRPADLFALYRRADVALVTPLRDGLNLVCKEYVAAKGDQPGALVLSEFAGAAAEMGEAIMVNPWSRDSVVEGLAKALNLGEDERRHMMRRLYDRLSRFDNRAWSMGFVSTLDEAGEANGAGATADRSGPDIKGLKKRVVSARRVFVFMDYDGTLVPVENHPELAVPDAKVLALLEDMAAVPGFFCCVISGRDRAFLEDHLPRDINLVAEHGACLRAAGSDSCVELVDRKALETFQAQVLGVMSDVEKRVPGSRIERKEYGIVWHYRMADPIVGRQQALELADSLGELLRRTPLGVSIAKKAVEVRPTAVNKGDALRSLLQANDWDPQQDMLITMGDDRTDEDMFRVEAEHNISVNIGEVRLQAVHAMEQSQLVDLLCQLTAAAARGRSQATVAKGGGGAM